jgi:uncharacterized protein (DUF1778 family)
MTRNQNQHTDRSAQAPMASQANHLPDQPDAMRLSVHDQLRIAQALSLPPEPNAALRCAFERRRALTPSGS